MKKVKDYIIVTSVIIVFILAFIFIKVVTKIWKFGYIDVFLLLY